jgi:hypothetical protein
MSYVKNVWVDGTAGTPATASWMNHIEDGIAALRTDLPFFMGASAPASPPPAYAWLQTGLGTGHDFTLWIEDGL